ncbi:CagY family CD-EC repeat-containing protein [Helicobacter pylori]
MDCVSRARNEKEKKECEKLLTPEARKFLANARNCSPLKRKNS